jgi:DNA helicase HerA-like ATPase
MADANVESKIFVGRGAQEVCLLARMANRHGLIAGATGTGKTVTLRVLAEGFSRLGTSVFLADVKGDLAGMALPAPDDGKFRARAESLGMTDYQPAAASVTFWDVLGEQGHPVRTTISEMGPLLLGRLLDLNDTQEGVLNVVFKAADDEGLLLLDLKDLQAMLAYVGQNAKQYSTRYGNVSPASVAAIQRGLLALGEQGGEKFFGEPALNVHDLLSVDANGRGIVNILAADKLILAPKVYSTFLLWLLAELYETLPEVGDMDKPKLVFFFDEAHLLFDTATKALIEKVEQVVRLVRSKGVGVYFVSQLPLDVPEAVRGQLGNRVQHALRSFTTKDQRAVRAAAETFRTDNVANVATTIGHLAVGEALVSMLDNQGVPIPVQQATIAPPTSRLGTISPAERDAIVRASRIAGRYDQISDRDSAYERLKARAEQSVAEEKVTGERRSRRQTPTEAAINSAARTFGSQVMGQIIRGIFGSLFGGSRRRR